MNNLEFKEAYTPAKLTAKNRSLNIPIYQRLFVWEEEQIELLLDDLNKVFGNNSPYYIGIITVFEKDNKWDIVDGQQRLTFLSLFGAYCCLKNPNSIWKTFLFTENNKLRINYMGRVEDEGDLKKIIQGGTDVVNRNFRIFLECMNKKFSNSISEDFEMYVYNYASFLITELPSSYTPQDLNLFFEKLNATGKQLTMIEQIKGKYFPASAAEFDAVLNFDKNFSDKENPKTYPKTLGDILSDFQTNVEPESDNKKSDISNRSILTAEVFLLHSLNICKRYVSKDDSKDDSKDKDDRKILETFKNNIESTNNRISPDRLLATMKEYRKWIDANIIYLRESSDGSWEYAFRSEDNKEKEYEDKAAKESDADVNIRLKMKQFQAMLYVSSSSFQEWVLEAYCSCVKGNDFSLKLLTEQDNERHKDDSPVMKYPTINRYWFWKLDYLLWEMFMDSKVELENYNFSQDDQDAINAILCYKFRRNRSIEHLHPQMDGDEWEDDNKHKFGNLAMISSSFNSLQQNDSIGVKFARLRDTQIPQKKLESIKMLLMFKLAGGQERGWTVDVMRKHERAMFDLMGIKNNNN